MLNNKFFEDYKRGLDSIFASSPLFGNLAASLGKPIETLGDYRAFVAFNSETKNIEFHLDSKYISELTDDEIGAVIAHETYHVLLDHLNEKISGDYINLQVLNIAHECIINDGLSGNVGLELPENVVYGTDLYQEDFSIFSTKEAYNFIIEKLEEEDNSLNNKDTNFEDTKDSEFEKQESEEDSNQAISSGSCGGVQIDKEQFSAWKTAVADGINNATKEAKDKDVDIPTFVQDVLEDLSNDNESIIKNWSIKGSGVKESFYKEEIPFNWKSLLSKINPKINSFGKKKVKYSFQQPHRRMMSVYPKVILPSPMKEVNNEQKGDSIPTAIIVLDFSYSIPHEMIGKLVSMSESIPDDIIHSKLIAFSDSVYEFDPNTVKNIYRGSTNIDSVTNYVQEYSKKNNIEPYIICISDGDCYLKEDINKNWMNKNKNKWFWISTPNKLNVLNRHWSHISPKENIYKMEDFNF